MRIGRRADKPGCTSRFPHVPNGASRVCAMDPFPALYEAFLRAAEADSGLRKESFLEQARHHIAEGKLRASGRRFSVKWTRRGGLIFRADVPRENKTESPDRVEI